MRQHVHEALDESSRSLTRLQDDTTTLAVIEAAAQALIATFSNGGHVFSCGNGGSLCDAMHFAEELSGRFRRDRPGLPATAISDPAHISCVANDFGYDAIFSRYDESHGRKGDVLLAISTSGSSPNVIKAAQAARERGISHRPDWQVAGTAGRTCRSCHLHTRRRFLRPSSGAAYQGHPHSGGTSGTGTVPGELQH